LPFAADDVLDHEVDLRPVKCRLTRFETEGTPRLAAAFLQAVSALSHCSGWPTYFALSGSRRADPHAVVRHAERAEDDLHELQASHQLGGKLFFGDEEMGINPG